MVPWYGPLVRNPCKPTCRNWGDPVKGGRGPCSGPKIIPKIQNTLYIAQDGPFMALEEPFEGNLGGHKRIFRSIDLPDLLLIPNF